ncbi:LytS/YhcK type 5TM receptor domain-containing protein, partial [Bacillus subtilis]|uniref:LytS/YhcK type 5TM receptor domain-containing protein n=1 Tax=Bacillus subtilis TaxID=1423 RepID=UPI00254634A3
MMIILVMAKALSEGWEVVRMMGIAMILMNGRGSFIFVCIIQGMIGKEEEGRALERHRVVRIADQTVPFLC